MFFEFAPHSTSARTVGHLTSCFSPQNDIDSARGSHRHSRYDRGTGKSEIGMSIPITQRLRDATRALHTEVERAGVMRSLLRGQLERAGYCRLLRNLHAIYSALEAGLAQHASDPGLVILRCQPLFRSDALREDLNFLHGADWADAIPLTAAATQYAEHLRGLAARAPLLLGAHAYVRYLGDLSGGQMLTRIVAKSLGLQLNQGVSFYDFGNTEEVAKLAKAFRTGLDLMVDSETNALAVVEEACAAFERHTTLFEELAEP